MNKDTKRSPAHMIGFTFADGSIGEKLLVKILCTVSGGWIHHEEPTAAERAAWENGR